MKRYSVEIKIIVLITFAVITVMAAGFLAFNSINFILTTIEKEAQPNYSLLVLKEINNNLQKGESQVEYYSLTGDKKYLEPYYQVRITVQNRIDSLDYYSAGNPLRQAQIDTINLLLDRKFRMWEIMINRKQEDHLEDALTQLSLALDEVPDTMTLQVPQSVTVEVTDTTSEMEDIIPEEQKEGFFARLFKKKTEEAEQNLQADLETDSVQIEEIIEAKDTSINVGVDKDIIHNEIVRLKELEGEKMRKLAAYEISLKQRNNEITSKLSRLISRIEKEELESLKRKAREADRLVDVTNKWSFLFLLLFFNLLIGVIFVIQRYIRKSNATQVALTRAKDAAIRLSETKEQFLANMSHEIRTPMNAIVGFTEQILHMPLAKESREQLEIVKKSADHLLNIINDILDFSKLEAGKVSLEMEPFNAYELFSQARQLYQPSASLKNNKLEVEYDNKLPKVLVGDSFRLRQIVFNLLSNAIKFTDNGEVSVRCFPARVTEESIGLIIEVKDSGIGIEEEKLNSIFEEFTQADISTSRNYGGTGLGLAIVRKLVKLHGGQISARNNEEGGACFKVELKYQIGAEKDLIQASDSDIVAISALASYKILIADDDEYNRKLIQHILEKWKMDFTVVNGGKEVLAIIDKNEFDLLLLDIHMPSMNGYDVATAIRRHEKKRVSAIPIIALTATVAKDEIKRVREVGMNDVLSKPYTEKELFGKIAHTMAIDGIALQKETSAVTEKELPKSEVEFTELYVLANNDKRFVKDMLQMFVKNTQNDILDIKGAYKQKSWEELAELAHKIKAPCKHLDAKDLSALLKDLELTARKGENEALITILYNKSLNDVDLLIKRVGQHLKNNFSKS